ncbi:hypothetical protein LJC58_08005, partial [Lachnospiraceae bacterium OttesenSCG-928-D06]|nr:hypothetical protein [Lachnospiraceae bacterium OttesenSCG-928-D06]
MKRKLIPTRKERKEYLAYKSSNDFFNNLESGLADLKENDLGSLENCVLICGAMAGFDNGILNFLNNYACYLKRLGFNSFLLSEVAGEYKRYTKKYITFPYMCTPHLLSKEIVLPNLRIQVSKEMTELLVEKEYINDVILNLEKRHPSLGNGYALAWSYYAYKYINILLDKLSPVKVILWNQFYAFHVILKRICNERGITLIYMEFGNVPGTISIETVGQQGESLMAMKKSSISSFYLQEYT